MGISVHRLVDDHGAHLEHLLSRYGEHLQRAATIPRVAGAKVPNVAA